MNILYVDASYVPQTKKACISVPAAQLMAEIKAKTSLAAELIAIIRAMVFIKQKQINCIICSDCKVAVSCIKRYKIIKNHQSLCLALFKLYREVKYYITLQWVSRKHPGIKKAHNKAYRNR